MQRAGKPTGEWCAPTAELATPQLLQLLHTLKTTPDEAELEIIHDDLLVEATPAPIVRELSSEEEAAIAEAEPVLLAPVPTGETGAHPVMLAEPARPSMRSPPAPVYPVHRRSGSIVRSLFVLALVLGAAAGGVLVAMNVVA